MPSPLLMVLNVGSSSVKFASFEASDLRRRGAGNLDLHQGLSLQAAIQEALASAQGAPILAVGHRVVHGGARFQAPLKVGLQELAELAALSPLAPLHQPANVEGLRQAIALAPGILQVACFDTAFHHTQSEALTRFPLPLALHEAGLRRYGFHGLSYEHVASRLPEALGPELAEGRVVVAHLGSGASACAMLGRRSVNTTMGFSPLDGLVMGTRPGSLDPGVVLHLAFDRQLSRAELERLLYKESGLKALGGSADMRVLLASEAPEAQAAVEAFCHRAAEAIASLAVSLGGLDALVFCGGIGEHAPAIRERIVAKLACLGPFVSAVVPTDEEEVIARHTATLLRDQGPV